MKNCIRMSVRVLICVGVGCKFPYTPLYYVEIHHHYNNDCILEIFREKENAP